MERSILNSILLRRIASVLKYSSICLRHEVLTAESPAEVDGTRKNFPPTFNKFDHKEYVFILSKVT